MERKVLETLRSMRHLWLALMDPSNWKRSQLWYRGGRAAEEPAEGSTSRAS